MSGTKTGKKIRFVALDSNIFIYNLTQNPKYVQYTDTIIAKLSSNELHAVTSIISLGEILSFPHINKDTEQIIITDFFTTPNLTVLDVDQIIITEAAKVRRKYGFRLPDCLQIATAKLEHAQIFITNDYKLTKYEELKVISLSDVIKLLI